MRAFVRAFVRVCVCVCVVAESGKMSDLPVFSQKSLSSPGMKVSGSLSSAQVSLRVYGGNALLSPGAEYKSVLARQETTAAEVCLTFSSSCGVRVCVCVCVCGVLFPHFLLKSPCASLVPPCASILLLLQVIAQALERYGEPSDPKEFELRSVLVNERTGKVKRSGSFARLWGHRTDTVIVRCRPCLACLHAYACVCMS